MKKKRIEPMNTKIIKDAERYHVYVAGRDMWLSRLELIELRRSINALAL